MKTLFTADGYVLKISFSIGEGLSIQVQDLEGRELPNYELPPYFNAFESLEEEGVSSFETALFYQADRQLYRLTLRQVKLESAPSRIELARIEQLCFISDPADPEVPISFWKVPQNTLELRRKIIADNKEFALSPKLSEETKKRCITYLEKHANAQAWRSRREGKNLFDVDHYALYVDFLDGTNPEVTKKLSWAQFACLQHYINFFWDDLLDACKTQEQHDKALHSVLKGTLKQDFEQFPSDHDSECLEKITIISAGLNLRSLFTEKFLSSLKSYEVFKNDSEITFAQALHAIYFMIITVVGEEYKMMPKIPGSFGKYMQPNHYVFIPVEPEHEQDFNLLVALLFPHFSGYLDTNFVDIGLRLAQKKPAEIQSLLQFIQGVLGRQAQYTSVATTMTAIFNAAFTSGRTLDSTLEMLQSLVTLRLKNNKESPLNFSLRVWSTLGLDILPFGIADELAFLLPSTNRLIRFTPHFTTSLFSLSSSFSSVFLGLFLMTQIDGIFQVGQIDAQRQRHASSPRAFFDPTALILARRPGPEEMQIVVWEPPQP